MTGIEPRETICAAKLCRMSPRDHIPVWDSCSMRSICSSGCHIVVGGEVHYTSLPRLECVADLLFPSLILSKDSIASFGTMVWTQIHCKSERHSNLPPVLHRINHINTCRACISGVSFLTRWQFFTLFECFIRRAPMIRLPDTIPLSFTSFFPL